MDKDTADKLAFDVRFALGQLRFKPPPRYDRDYDAADRYLSSVAQEIVKQIGLSWECRLKPPTQFVAGGERNGT